MVDRDRKKGLQYNADVALPLIEVGEFIADAAFRRGRAARRPSSREQALPELTHILRRPDHRYSNRRL